MEGSVWNSVTMRELLDRLEQVPADHDKTKQLEVEVQPSPEAAFLGPKLWTKPISFEEFNADDFSVMNFDDFLTENGMDKQNVDSGLKCDEKSPEPDEMRCANMASLSIRSPVSTISSIGSPSSDFGNLGSPISVVAPVRPSIIVSTKKEVIEPPPTPQPSEAIPEGNSFLYAESKRARLEREKAEKKRKLEEEIEFSAEDLALATVPGLDFDPKRRAFEAEELRPQPIIRKRAKIFVPDLEKDDRYWEKRCKNNFAARRSREARRLKENQIALRAAFLERENQALRRELDDQKFENAKIAMEREILKKQLDKFEN